MPDSTGCPYGHCRRCVVASHAFELVHGPERAAEPGFGREGVGQTAAPDALDVDQGVAADSVASSEVGHEPRRARL
jgi:hypothetical protein